VQNGEYKVVAPAEWAAAKLVYPRRLPSSP
jgi:hypothetical protein